MHFYLKSGQSHTHITELSKLTLRISENSSVTFFISLPHLPHLPHLLKIKT